MDTENTDSNISNRDLKLEEKSQLSQEQQHFRVKTQFEGKSSLSKPRKWIYFLVLVCLILQNYGNYYLTDIPQELGDSFTDYFNKTPQDVEFLYSIYALFAMPMTLLGGIVITAWNPRGAGVLLTLLIFISGIISWQGCIIGGESQPDKTKAQGKYWLILLGRMVYGFSAEVNEVTQNALIHNWFDGKILSIASGLAQVFNNLGEASSQLMTGELFHYRKFVSDPYLAGVAVTGISLFLLLIFAYFDKKYEKYLQCEHQVATEINDRRTEQFTIQIKETTFTHEDDMAHEFNYSNSEMNLKENPVQDSQKLLPIHNDDEDAPYQDISNIEAEMEDITDFDEAQPIRLSMFKDLKYPLIWASIYMFAITSVLETLWYSMATKLLIKKFKYTLIESNKLVFTQTLLGIVLIPVSAVYSQKYGKKNMMYIIGFISIILGFLILVFLPEGKSPLIYLSLFMYSFYQSIQDPIGWPALALCTPRSAVALTFGLAQFFNNVFGFLIPFWIGYQLKDDTGDSYINALWTLIIISIASLFVAIWAYFEDLRTGGVQHYPENSRHVRELKLCYIDKLERKESLTCKRYFLSRF